jgi:hypothetical protein
VRVREYGGEIITRRVVKVHGDIIAICQDDAYQAVLQDGREPVDDDVRIKIETRSLKLV